MAVREIVGIAMALVVLAGVSMAIVNGGQTAKVLGAAGDAFAGSIKAATLR